MDKSARLRIEWTEVRVLPGVQKLVDLILKYCKMIILIGVIMIGFIRIITVIGVAIASFITHKEFKKMSTHKQEKIK